MKRLDIQIGDVTLANLEQFKTLNVYALPVKYSTKFYKELLDKVPKELIKIAFHNGFAIGAICCRIDIEESSNTATDNNSSSSSGRSLENEENDNKNKIKKMYIMTLSILPAYRRRGVATELLNYALKEAERMGDIDNAFLHVQTSNEDALAFYEAKGFENIEIIKDYYRRIDPPDACLLQKTILTNSN